MNMKINNIISSLFFLAILLTGCYKDKGNYDYTNINRITIEEFQTPGWTNTYGDTLKIEPVLVYEDKTITSDEHLEYKWTFGGLTREGWNQKNFFWIADTVMEGYLILEVKDIKTGVSYYSQIHESVYPEFETTGVFVLAEKDGKSQLSFIQLDVENDYVNGTSSIESYKIFQNVYEERAGEVLGQKPLTMYEHYTHDGGSADSKTQLAIMQESNCVDVAAITMTKDIDFKEAFINKDYPSTLSYIKQICMMNYVDIAADQDGHLYSRIKLVENLFHSSFFMNEPLTYDGQVLEGCELLHSPSYDRKFSIIHDTKNSRLMAVFDGQANWDKPEQEGASKLVVLPANSAPTHPVPDGFIPLDNFGEYELVASSYYRSSGWGAEIGFFMIFKNNAGEYFRQNFIIEKGYSDLNLTIKEAEFSKIALPGAPSALYAVKYSNSSEDVFIAVGNELYRFDRLDPSSGIQLHLTFESNIVSVHSEVYYDRWAIVGLENGKVCALDIPKAKNLADDKKIIFESPDNVDFGRIVDAKIRTGGNGF